MPILLQITEAAGAAKTVSDNIVEGGVIYVMCLVAVVLAAVTGWVFKMFVDNFKTRIDELKADKTEAALKLDKREQEFIDLGQESVKAQLKMANVIEELLKSDRGIVEAVTIQLQGIIVDTRKHANELLEEVNAKVDERHKRIEAAIATVTEDAATAATNAAIKTLKR